MVPALRTAFNETFTRLHYKNFLADLNSRYPGAIEFRLAETPVFVPASFSTQLTEACESIIDLIAEPRFKKWTQRAIPAADSVANENDHPHFLVFDFGVCEDGAGGWRPQLIEMQGFASLYGFQVYYPEVLRRHFPVPDNYSQFLNGYHHDSYLELLKETILGSHAPENVILLELKPHEQKTRVDFYCTRDYLGIQPVCLTELIQEGKQLYYLHPATGRKTLIKRIYNRIIFDELHAAGDKIGEHVDIRQELDVEWVAHPNWFYRVSKFTLPFIRHPFVPPTFFRTWCRHRRITRRSGCARSGELDTSAQGQICQPDPDSG